MNYRQEAINRAVESTFGSLSDEEYANWNQGVKRAWAGYARYLSEAEDEIFWENDPEEQELEVINSFMAVNCLDCGMEYKDMGLDLVIPDQQWKTICPEGGILCANCICKRAEKLGATSLLAWVDSMNYLGEAA